MKKICLLAILALSIGGCDNKPLIQCQEQNTLLEAEIDAMESILASSMEQNQDCTKQAQAQAQAFKATISEQSDKIGKIQDKMTLATTELKEKLANAAQQIKEFNNKCKDYEAKVANITQDLANAKTDSDQQTQKSVELQNKLNVSQTKNTELSSQIEALQKQNADLVAKIKELENAITELKAKQSESENTDNAKQ